MNFEEFSKLSKAGKVFKGNKELSILLNNSKLQGIAATLGIVELIAGKAIVDSIQIEDIIKLLNKHNTTVENIEIREQMMYHIKRFTKNDQIMYYAGKIDNVSQWSTRQRDAKTFNWYTVGAVMRSLINSVAPDKLIIEKEINV